METVDDNESSAASSIVIDEEEEEMYPSTICTATSVRVVYVCDIFWLK